VYFSMFDVDGQDPQDNGLPKIPIPGPNQALAHKMGIVMGTSHHEPMARNKPEWDLEGHGSWDWTNKETLIPWWEYGAERARTSETLYTLGLRGDGDRPLDGANKELLEGEFNPEALVDGPFQERTQALLNDAPQRSSVCSRIS